tara:strand:- start:7787 stop:8353 length:567 start_codon:yes stop_codon:yes gene_type:complete
MTINTTATVSTDIIFQQQDTTSTSFDNRQGSLGFSLGLVSGTGALIRQIDAVYSLQEYIVASGDQLKLDFTNLSQPIWGSTFNVSFTGVKSLAIYNHNTGIGQQISIRATGANPFDEIFNEGSGNLLIKPTSSYIYSDPNHGLLVNSSNKNLYISNTADIMPPLSGTGSPYSTGIVITVVAVGVTGGS